eukprot:m.81055 g.81055  ORF g.81055 m.81055 type:complete len:418 (+) comp8068_c0_seq3:5049-6302(+)
MATKLLEAVCTELLECVSDHTILLDLEAAEVLRWSVGLATLVDAGSTAVHLPPWPALYQTRVTVVLGRMPHECQKELTFLARSRGLASVSVLSMHADAECLLATDGHFGYEALQRHCLGLLAAADESAAVRVIQLFAPAVSLTDTLVLLPRSFNYSVVGTPATQSMAELKLACQLNDLLCALDARDEVFTVGPAAMRVADRLAVLDGASSRASTASHKTSLVIIDRSVDLLELLWHHDSVASRLFASESRLPFSNDVAVSLGRLFGDDPGADYEIVGSLAHPSDSDARKALASILESSDKEVFTALRRPLLDALGHANIHVRITASMGRATARQLLDFMKPVLVGGLNLCCCIFGRSFIFLTFRSRAQMQLPALAVSVRLCRSSWERFNQVRHLAPSGRGCCLSRSQLFLGKLLNRS